MDRKACLGIGLAAIVLAACVADFGPLYDLLGEMGVTPAPGSAR